VRIAASGGPAQIRRGFHVSSDPRLDLKPTHNDGSLPVMTYYLHETPNICANIWHAQHALGKDGTGWPSILTYDPKGSSGMTRRQKRYGMDRDGVPSNASPGTSRDEYPFASTVENMGSVFISHVPIAEQTFQARKINAFYRDEGAYKSSLHNPFWFEVRVVGYRPG
jgi:hypothetical protein